MPSVYEHELGAYRREIDLVRDGITAEAVHTAYKAGTNITHLSLGLSNRANMIVVGLCGLVESLLAGFALQAEAATPFRLNDMRGMGRDPLELFLKRTGAIEFGQLSQWAKFKDLYLVRNAIVHGHGGLIQESRVAGLKKALGRLEMSDVLVAERRVRMKVPALESSHRIVSTLIEELLDDGPLQI